MIDIPKLRAEFFAKYGSEPRIFRAPGRINLIGEYTDINDGFVLPAAINFATYVAAAPRNDRQIRAASSNFEGELRFELDEPHAPVSKDWTKFIQGVGVTIELSGYKLQGADLLIDSDIPVGAGLSSSAALEVSTAFALSTLSGHQIAGIDLAKVGQSVEHDFAGVRSGIMDQFASVFGQANHAILLDCRSLEWSAVPISQANLIICDTKVKHSLAESEYNKRRSECEGAAQFFGLESLRDVSSIEFESKSRELPQIPMRRARHVLTENRRVHDAVKALSDNDLAQFGRLLDESHESLRADFEVSCQELDLMVDIARKQRGVLGARMMGGGFGGCTINLVETAYRKEFVTNMLANYRFETGVVPDLYECDIADGVCEIGLTNIYENGLRFRRF